MTPEQEDALIESSLKATVQTNGTTFFVYSSKEAMRLAIRAAVAQERERCAKVCEELECPGDSPADDLSYEIATGDCAAAIRRG